MFVRKYSHARLADRCAGQVDAAVVSVTGEATLGSVFLSCSTALFGLVRTKSASKPPNAPGAPTNSRIVSSDPASTLVPMMPQQSAPMLASRWDVGSVVKGNDLGLGQKNLISLIITLTNVCKASLSRFFHSVIDNKKGRLMPPSDFTIAYTLRGLCMGAHAHDTVFCRRDSLSISCFCAWMAARRRTSCH